MPILAYWRWIALAVLLAASAAFGGATVYRHMNAKLRALQSDFDAFRGGVAALGIAAQKAATAKRLADQQRKDAADAENARSTADLNRTIAGLRLAADRARGRIVPAAPAASSRPDLACFDRTLLEQAIGGLVGSVRGIAETGDQTAVDLNTAREWARK